MPRSTVSILIQSLTSLRCQNPVLSLGRSPSCLLRAVQAGLGVAVNKSCQAYLAGGAAQSLLRRHATTTDAGHAASVHAQRGVPHGSIWRWQVAHLLMSCLFMCHAVHWLGQALRLDAVKHARSLMCMHTVTLWPHDRAPSNPWTEPSRCLPPKNS